MEYMSLMGNIATYDNDNIIDWKKKTKYNH